MDCLPRPVIMMIWSHPAAMASSTPYWMMGLSTMGNISLGWALVAGRKRVPSPAAGKTALRTFIFMQDDLNQQLSPFDFRIHNHVKQPPGPLDADLASYVGTELQRWSIVPQHGLANDF